MNVPANLKYSNDHEWCRVEGGEAFIGITDFAQSQLGDIVFVDVPTVGETLSAGESETDRSQGVRVAAYRRAVQRVDRLIFVRCK